MALAHKKPMFESEAQRRGKLKSDTPGEYHFTDPRDAILLVQSEIRESKKTYKRMSEGAGISGSTVGNMASGKTKRPGWLTMFGIADDLGIEFVGKRRRLQ